ncbi:formimidoylglutamate deiminase [Agrobacterium tumefaciens]|uniref:Riorf38 protein n=2 Tax=Rhizobium/Agrobacterium group TaxID=227290 RepID=Q9KWE6_RHIRH|nr:MULTISPECIES: formimidoylglutamate deiminase [Rhizobium/Agrobacterium group]ASK42918.1 formimidoylglutamate deiminase [Rhizobium rhizogenes]MCZ7976428.1 formimidoylglutamate deiminase [Agrobacterium salinitolerans]MDA5243316.1 formimidoylglutamate deiminase [Agrobacterium sp. MAFF310724]MDA5247502.1 formimidoylglutamate deiminase [Agrobacterium sp. MAFF210268]TRB03335.1 formimidoylglutamate deiminase [Agrobacterium tumefaciens]
MKIIHADHALLPSGWAKNVEIVVEEGRIISAEAQRAKPDARAEKHAFLVPAMPNLHSHAFQRAMAGLTELRSNGNDTFWSWRTVMYRFALSMTPDQVEAVAAQLYMEMLEAGFGRVGEFHYLHHDQNGGEYSNIAEMAERVCAAATQTGIAMTLLPVFYAHSGFGGLQPSEGQRRFINSVDSFDRLLDACRAIQNRLPGMQLGIAPHSLRAATPDELSAILPLAGNGPIHIHVAEQTKEVEDCIAWSGARPVEWLLANAPVDQRWCLIHATHLENREVNGIAKCGAVAGLCPITEANLGDGIFRAEEFIAAGGTLGVGSDSNVLISMSEELRMLEYSQRLQNRSRNVIANPGASTGQRLFELALQGGNRALAATSRIASGSPADFISLAATDHPWLNEQSVLDHFIFAGSPKPNCVWVGGEKLVADGRHRSRDQLQKRFKTVMNELFAKL